MLDHKRGTAHLGYDPLQRGGRVKVKLSLEIALELESDPRARTLQV